MSTAPQIQNALADMGETLGRSTLKLFRDHYLRSWPDEEATTGALLGALAALASRTESERTDLAVNLRAKLTRKRDEAKHGADVLIRFICDEPEWEISTSTLIQAKRQEPDRPLVAGEHTRLMGQIDKMLSFTTEAFVMIYSEDRGIQLVPAVAARALGGRDLFQMATINWAGFLSALLRGRLGEPLATRVPGPDDDWSPTWVLEIEAVARREIATMAYATA